MHRVIVWAVCLLVGCEGSCDKPAPPAEASAQSTPAGALMSHAPSEARQPAAATGSAISHEQLASLFARDQLGSYRATSPTTSLAPQLPNGHTLPQARRTYVDGDVTLTVEVMDALFAPTVRANVMRSQTIKRETDNGLMMGFEFKGHPAIKQWTRSNQTARVGTMLRDRIILNVSVSPATDPSPALAAAELLDYAAALAMITEAQPTK